MDDGYAGAERRAECAQGVALGVEVDNLKKYQYIQNGHLNMIKKHLWTLVLLMLTTLLSACGALAMLLIMRAGV